jgi:hypothetical protein
VPLRRELPGELVEAIGEGRRDAEGHEHHGGMRGGCTPHLRRSSTFLPRHPLHRVPHDQEVNAEPPALLCIVAAVAWPRHPHQLGGILPRRDGGGGSGVRHSRTRGIRRRTSDAGGARTSCLRSDGGGRDAEGERSGHVSPRRGEGLSGPVPPRRNIAREPSGALWRPPKVSLTIFRKNLSIRGPSAVDGPISRGIGLAPDLRGRAAAPGGARVHESRSVG